VTGRRVEGGITRINIGLGSERGVEVGMSGYLTSESGYHAAKIKITSVDGSGSIADVGTTEDDISAYKLVVINPSSSGDSKPVQRAATAATAARDPDYERVHALSGLGIAGSGSSLPFLDTIQRSFGPHDVSGVVAHTDGAAARAATGMGATAYATGNHVAFAGTPDLHTAAHEAAHVVQQRAGAHLKGGVGETGDLYERHADAVADRVVQGLSAASLLGEVSATSSAPAVQRKDAVDPLADSLEIVPKTVSFGRVEVGGSARRMVSIINRSAGMPQRIGEFVGNTPAPPHGDWRPRTQTPRGFSPPEVYPGAIVAYSDPFRLAASIPTRMVDVGASADVAIDFAPVVSSDSRSYFEVHGSGGFVIGRIDVDGQGRYASEGPDEHKHPEARIASPTPTKDLDVHQAREVALTKLGPWGNLAHKKMEECQTVLQEEWTEYLMATASNPGLSRRSLPTESALRNILQSSVAAGAKYVAKAVFAKMVETAAGGAIFEEGAAMGAIFGPEGAIVGAAIGWLVGKYVDHLFKPLVSRDDKIRAMMEDAYREGFADGVDAVGNAIKQTLGQLGNAAVEASQHLGESIDQYATLINGATDLKRVQRLSAEIDAQMALVREVKPQHGFHHHLLDLWVRDHTTSHGSEPDVAPDQWQRALEDHRVLVERPDLFIHETLKAFDDMGLPEVPAHEIFMREALAELGGHENGELSEQDSMEVARKAKEKLTGHRFRWNSVQWPGDYDHNDVVLELTLGASGMSCYLQGLSVIEPKLSSKPSWGSKVPGSLRGTHHH
jgi:hypothetical protein